MPGPISYHAAACPSRGGQWRGLVSHRGAKAEVLLGAAVGRVSQFKIYMFIVYIYIYYVHPISDYFVLIQTYQY